VNEYVSLAIGAVLIPGAVWLSNLHARVSKLEIIAENTEKILQLLLERELNSNDQTQDRRHA
jgi:hypothetical protein